MLLELKLLPNSFLLQKIVILQQDPYICTQNKKHKLHPAASA